uniref:Large ribosomal subunit protein uL23m n=1 Tax=Sus scrofa TaxID=9823 RepID=A0A8D1DSS4_PIG
MARNVLYPLYQLGNPQLRVFRTNFFIQLVRPGTAQPEDTVQFRIPMEMTRVDLRNYLERIYNVPVAAVRTRVQYGSNRRRDHRNIRIKKPDYKVAYVQLVSLRLTSAMTLVLIPMKPRRSQGSERGLAVGGGGGDLLGVAMPGTGGSAGWGGGLRQKSELAGLAAVFWGPGWPLPTGPQHGASGQLLLPRLLPGRGLGEGGPKPRAGDSETHTFPARLRLPSLSRELLTQNPQPRPLVPRPRGLQAGPSDGQVTLDLPGVR